MKTLQARDKKGEICRLLQYCQLPAKKFPRRIEGYLEFFTLFHSFYAVNPQLLSERPRRL
jgi:hypothetical protein